MNPHSLTRPKEMFVGKRDPHPDSSDRRRSHVHV